MSIDSTAFVTAESKALASLGTAGFDDFEFIAGTLSFADCETGQQLQIAVAPPVALIRRNYC